MFLKSALIVIVTFEIEWFNFFMVNKNDASKFGLNRANAEWRRKM